jgi:hypothetical protein
MGPIRARGEPMLHPNPLPCRGAGSGMWALAFPQLALKRQSLVSSGKSIDHD